MFRGFRIVPSCHPDGTGGARPPSSPAPDPPERPPSVLLAQLTARVRLPAVVLGVGNDLRGDDAFGLEAVRLLSSRGPIPGVTVLEVGVSPEGFAERVARESPRIIVVLDAARMGGAPGELRLIEPGDLGWDFAGGTHAPSLELLSRYLAERCGAEVLLLAAEPERTGLGEEMTPRLCEAASLAAEILREAFLRASGWDSAGT